MAPLFPKTLERPLRSLFSLDARSNRLSISLPRKAMGKQPIKKPIGLELSLISVFITSGKQFFS
jgi:hypothetical protein